MAPARASIVDVYGGGHRLLIRRSPTDPRRPGEWDMPGGHVEPGETAEQGALREVFEEVGIKLKPSDLQLVRVENRKKGSYHFYRVDLPRMPEVKLSFEHDRYMWVNEAKTNPKWLARYLEGKDTSGMTAEQKAKEAKKEAAYAVGSVAAVKAGTKLAAKQAVKAGGAAVPGVGWAVTGAMMTYDAGPEAWAVGKEGIQKGKKALAEVRGAKGLRAKAKAVGRGYSEGVKHGLTGVARVGSAAVVGSDVVKMGREAYAEKQMKKNSLASTALRAAREVSPEKLASAAKSAGIGLLAVTGLAKTAAREGVEIKEIVQGKRKNPAASAEANYREIQKMLNSMPTDWHRQYRSGARKLELAGGPVLPLKPKPEDVVRLIGITAGGNLSKDKPTGPNKVPAEVREAAMKGLRLSHKNNYGAWDMIGIARAIELAIVPSVSDETVRRMRNYFTRHLKDKKSANFGNDAVPSRGYMAWLNWGGDEGYDWAARKPKENPSKSTTFRADFRAHFKNGDMYGPVEGYTKARYADLGPNAQKVVDQHRVYVLAVIGRINASVAKVDKNSPQKNNEAIGDIVAAYTNYNYSHKVKLQFLKSVGGYLDEGDSYYHMPTPASAAIMEILEAQDEVANTALWNFYAGLEKVTRSEWARRSFLAIVLSVEGVKDRAEAIALMPKLTMKIIEHKDLRKAIVNTLLLLHEYSHALVPPGATPCRRCGGIGFLAQFLGVMEGQCFACGGTGVKKNSSGVRPRGNPVLHLMVP